MESNSVGNASSRGVAPHVELVEHPYVNETLHRVRPYRRGNRGATQHAETADAVAAEMAGNRDTSENREALGESTLNSAHARGTL